LPPVMERTFRDDLKWAPAVLAGATLGYTGRCAAGDAHDCLSPGSRRRR
jgi:hypothetical protein